MDKKKIIKQFLPEVTMSCRIRKVFFSWVFFLFAVTGAWGQTAPTVPTSITVSVSPATVKFGDPVTLTATITAGIGTPTGTVQFLGGATIIGTAPVTSSGTAILTLTALHAGSNAITAVYSGDATFLGSRTPSSVNADVSWPPKLNGPPSTHTLTVGSGPVAMALNPLTHLLYVANQGSNDVTVIDSHTNNIVVPSIPVGPGPAAIVVNPQTNMIYVANMNWPTNSVTVIDGATNQVSATVSVGRRPVALAINFQTNQIYVGGGVCIIDGATNQLIANSVYCDSPAVVVSPLTGQAYDAVYGDNTVFISESLTNLGLASFGTSFHPQAFALNPPFIYIGGPSDWIWKIKVFDEFSNTNSGDISFDSSPYALTVNPVDNKLYAAAYSATAGQAATVTVIDGTSNTILRNIPVGQAPVYSYSGEKIAPNKIALDPTANIVYVANELTNDVSVIDGDLLYAITTVSTGSYPSTLVLNPEFCNLYVANSMAGTVTVIDTVSNGPGVCLSTASLVYPGQGVGTTSAPQTVTLTNIGNADLTVSSLATTKDYLETDNCSGKIIPVGGQCTIQVRFAPSSQGILTGKITITDNNSSSPHTIILTGDGVLPTTTTLVADANPAVYGQTINLVATVTSNSGIPTTGSVAFMEGQTLLGYARIGYNGTAAFPSPPLRPAGSSHSFTAIYHGNALYAASASNPLVERVNRAATTTIGSCSPCTALQGQPVTLSALVTVNQPGYGDPKEPSGIVFFREGQAILGAVPLSSNGWGGAKADMTLSTLTNGVHTITVSYPGDTNLMASVFVPIQVTVTPPPPPPGPAPGPGTGCACTKIGDYVAPALPVSPKTGTMLSSTWVFGSQNWAEHWNSPNQKYSLDDYISIDPLDSHRTDALRVTKNSDGSTVANLGPASLTNWGFSPDDDRFYYRTTVPDPSGAGFNIVDIYVYDLTVSPAKQIFYTQPPSGVTSYFNGFSPSGAYFIYNYAQGSNINLQIYKVQGVSQQTLQYHDNFPVFLAPIPGHQILDIGFSPDSPETTFVYEYLTGQTTKQWTLATLVKPQSVLKQNLITDLDFWQYSPCGDMIGLVTQVSQTATDVHLYTTDTGTGFPVTRVPEVSVFLLSTATEHQAKYYDSNNNFQPTFIKLASNTCATSSSNNPPPNTSAGPNSGVSDQNTATNNTISVTFDTVITPGDTSVDFTSGGPAPPSGFEILGNPTVYFGVTTTASYSAPITICIGYDALPPTITTPTTMLHYVGTSPNGHWEDVTLFNDVTNRLLCGQANSLSPFVIGSFSTPNVPADTTPPVITNVPSNMTVGATSSAGAVVSYTLPTANDAVSGIVPVICTPLSGSVFPIGTTTVACMATDGAGNTATASFTVSVVDTTPPVISNTPANMTVEATSSVGALVSYTLPTANDAVSGVVPVICAPLSGSVFPIGTTTVACTATDGAGNTATASFTVSVVDTTPPVISNTPANMTVGATSSAGALASYTLPTANDAVSGIVPVICAPLSGSVFPIGTTTVACTAKDAAGNTATASFTVTVNPIAGGMPLVRLSHPALNFGDEELGESKVRTEVLSNIGTAQLAINSITLTGDFIRISGKRGDCGSTLPVGTSCIIAIRFSPTATGVRKGVLTITTNAANSPHTVGLEGRGKKNKRSKHLDIERGEIEELEER
jgi:YVTN family beta-propeller protein